MSKITYGIALLAGILTLTFSFTASETGQPAYADETAAIDDRIYEMRIYTTHPGKLDDLHTRFKNHTLQLFAKHGMVNVGYWIPVDQENTLIYILAYSSREVAEKSWEAFRNDPEWQKVYEESHAEGEIVSNVESVFMKAAPYSQIR